MHCNNWPSATKFSNKVAEYIDNHLQTGAIEGPLTEVSQKYRTSPIGAFLKKDSDKVHVIHDLSHPAGISVNDSISKEESSVCYSSVQDAVKLCTKFRQPWMAKTDIKDAYLMCPVNYNDRDLLGFVWYRDDEAEFYRYGSMALGLRSSARLFSDIAHALRYMYVKEGAAETSLFYLDDIITLSGSYEECLSSLNTIIRVVRAAGFDVQDRKTIGPSRVIEYLGVEIDTIKCRLRISSSKLREIQGVVQEYLNKELCTKRELLSVIGKLNHAAQVVNYGCLFIRRLISVSKKPKSLHHRIHVGRECKADLRWWDKSLSKHEGIKYFPTPFIAATAQLLYTDASDTGAAAVLGKKWTAIEFTGKFKWLKDKSIMYREMYAVVLGVATFSYNLRGTQVLMHIDNQAVHHCIAAAKSKDYEINFLESS